jgi:ketosteroid isomerase-like protein
MLEPLATIERLVHATNAHDLDALVGCFADDYVLDAPANPSRSFRGLAQVRNNWMQIFAAVPDIRTEIVRSAVDPSHRETIWTEWEMGGTRRDGAPHLMRGVFIFGVSDGLVRWGRMFLSPVEESGPNMSAAVAAQLGSKQ